MGVSGSGKTTIATLLAEHLQYSFADGDDFHPPHTSRRWRGESR
jgi:gluconokinase